MNELKLLKDVVFETYGQNEHFDELQKKFIDCYNIFLKEVKGFKKLNFVTKYEILSTTILIATQTSTSIVRQFRILKESDPTDLKYSLESNTTDTSIYLTIS